MSKSGIKPESVADMDAAILHSLNIESDEDAAKLVEHFVDEPGNGLISPPHIMDALTKFLRCREEAKEKKEGEGDGEAKRNAKKEKEKEKEREKGGMSEDAVKEYWERMAGVVPDKTVAIWERLEAEMIKYNQGLKERVSLLEGNEALRHQNDELKTLLNQYLSAKINEELIVPPVVVPLPQRRSPIPQNISSNTSSRTSSRQ